MVTANYVNDRATCCAEPVVFPKVGLKDLCNKLNVEVEMAHRALDDALAASRVYKKLLLM